MAADRAADRSGVPDRLVGWVFDVIGLLILFAGMGLVGALAPSTFPAVLIGGVAGAAMLVPELMRPKPRPAYLEPTKRPKPATRQQTLLLAAGMAMVGIFAFWVAQRVPPNLELVPLGLIYFAGVAEGVALMMVLTERRTREAQHRWLAKMNPRSELEFDR